MIVLLPTHVFLTQQISTNPFPGSLFFLRVRSRLPCEQLVSPTLNERETTASNRLLFHRACASSSCPTWCSWCQVHLPIFFFCWKCFGTKESKCISPKALKKERFSCHCIFVIIVQKLLHCFNGKKTHFFTTSMFADRYFRTLPWHKKSQQSASKVVFPCLLFGSLRVKLLNAAVVLVNACVRA